MKAVWFRYSMMTFGILLAALALNLFLIPNRIAAGGVSGLATVLHYAAGLPVGMVMLAVNLPLLGWGAKLFGRRYILSTIYGAVMYSVLVDVTQPFVPVMTEDVFLASLYGGILTGVGMGLIFRSRGNTAGTAMVAAILHRYFGISVGQALLFADGIIVVLAGIVFASAELALYAVLSIFVTSKIIDMIQEGSLVSKAFLIVCNEPNKLAEKILKELGRGVTFLSARGGYSGERKEMLLCVVMTHEVSPLKELIQEHDPRSFVIAVDAHEVLGEGFTAMQ